MFGRSLNVQILPPPGGLPRLRPVADDEVALLVRVIDLHEQRVGHDHRVQSLALDVVPGVERVDVARRADAQDPAPASLGLDSPRLSRRRLARAEPAPTALATTSAVAASRTSIRRPDCPLLHVSSTFPSRCPGRFDDIDTIEVVPARALNRRHATTRGSINRPRLVCTLARVSAPQPRGPRLRELGLRIGRFEAGRGECDHRRRAASRSVTSRSGATSPSRRTDVASREPA